MTSVQADQRDQRFLTFKTGGRFYALPAASVSEVVRLPPIARVPQAPRSLMGLANLRGSILPVASVQALLGREEGAATSDVSPHCASTAHRLSRWRWTKSRYLVRVASENVKTAEADVASETGERLRGVFESNSHIIKILDVPELLRQAFVNSSSRRDACSECSQHKVERDSPDRCGPTTFGNFRGSRPGVCPPHSIASGKLS